MSGITVNMENLSAEERQTLMALIEKANAPKSKMWEPKNKENYYYIVSDGTVKCTIHLSDSIVDKSRLLIGNCFKTQEEAEFAIERLKVLHELRQFAGTKNADNVSYSLIFSTKNKIVDDVKQNDCITSAIWFDTIEDAKTAIETVGEDRIKKYYFMMED